MTQCISKVVSLGDSNNHALIVVGDILLMLPHVYTLLGDLIFVLLWLKCRPPKIFNPQNFIGKNYSVASYLASNYNNTIFIANKYERYIQYAYYSKLTRTDTS